MVRTKLFFFSSFECCLIIQILIHRVVVSFCRYHVPRSWLKPQNVIVVFEEWGGDTSGISLVKRI